MRFRNIYEKLGQTYDYSSVQLDFTNPIKQKVIDFGFTIPDKYLYTEGDNYGREDEIHCTIQTWLH